MTRGELRRKHEWFLLSIALVLVSAGIFATGAVAETRDPLTWPFAQDSVWNMPIGSNAVYVPTGLQPTAGYFGGDKDWWVVTSSSDPVINVYNPKSWTTRCGGTYLNSTTFFPYSVIIPDATHKSTPNACSAILEPDGRTIQQYEPTARCVAGGPLYGYQAATVDIYGDGTYGAHFGSGLSSIGGTIRMGELSASTGPIRHALKLEVYAHQYCWYSADRPGYRWPADRADSYANGNYAGTNYAVCMGSLLAIPPTTDINSLGLTTAVGLKIAKALQDYGGYIVDDTAWNAYQIPVEKNAATGLSLDDEVLAETGHSLWEGYYLPDMNKIFAALYVVDNNSPSSIGGGGTPRVPLAPPFDIYSPPVADFTGNPTSGGVPLTVLFSDASTNSPTSWSWTFGDGGTSTTQNPSHQYTAANAYTVTLTATNSFGSNTNTKTNYITVSSGGGNPPAAEFVGSPTSGVVPLTVNFTDQSTNSPTSWSWTFGDGGTSTAQNPSHQYTSADTYTVALTATNSYGSNTNTKTNYITVSPGGGGDFLCNSATVDIGTLVSGDHSSVHASDDSYLETRAAKAGSQKRNEQVTYTFNTGLPSLSSLVVTVEGKITISADPQSATQTVYVYNYSTSNWTQVKTSQLTTTDGTVTQTVSNPGSFISGGTVQVRVYVERSGTAYFNHLTDFVKISANP